MNNEDNGSSAVEELLKDDNINEVSKGSQVKKQAINKEYVNKLEEERIFLFKTVKRLEEETNVLRALFNKSHNELEELKKPSLLIADVVSVHGDNAIIKLNNGNKFYSYMNSDTRKNIATGDSVLVDQKSLNIIDKIEVTDSFEVEKYVIVDKPTETWSEVGGLKETINELKEVIEMPLLNPELFEKVGITPPKGVLLYGPPGTGKTLLAKAVANSTHATFIEVVGSELVQKFIGEGAKLVKEMFRLARRKAPAVIFIDEIDSLAARRMETGTSGEREVSRTFMQLLAELDGFESLGNIKVIAATNRIDILDPAIIRPGRLDRLIHVDLPEEEGRLEILKVHTRKMNLKRVKLKEISHQMDDFSGAEIRAVCTEAGYFAIREEREYVKQSDFLDAIEKVRIDEEEDQVHIFG
ncbi:AAA family ATPase [archaeon]|jgi:proteasome regulatory subunit|nr:AAA family ATPase [archaeon]MBT3450733.1 AAA family ATPase [archaeon]MBT6869225.1 AAA family ATPase [archaeon]MBT7193761.1 AAA family ATPase [archaeon]MBT7381408.1 AAA family ATPase [archaeon]